MESNKGNYAKHTVLMSMPCSVGGDDVLLRCSDNEDMYIVASHYDHDTHEYADGKIFDTLSKALDRLFGNASDNYVAQALKDASKGD